MKKTYEHFPFTLFILNAMLLISNSYAQKWIDLMKVGKEQYSKAVVLSMDKEMIAINPQKKFAAVVYFISVS